MPRHNPWLPDSVYPTAHFNPGATDSVPIAGPTKGRKLTVAEVKTVVTPFTSNPVVKTIGKDTVAFASGALGIQKILLTGDAFEPIAFLAFPGLEKEAQAATAKVVTSVLETINAAYRKKDDAAILKAVATMESMGVNMQTGMNGVYSLFDREGSHYCVYGGTRVLKTTDNDKARGRVELVKSVDVAAAMPPEAAKADAHRRNRHEL